MSLEVDRSNDMPIPQETQHGLYKNQAGKQSRDYPYSAGDNEPTKIAPAQQQSGQKSTIVLLSLALVIMIVLATLAAGVGGSLAAKRAHE